MNIKYRIDLLLEEESDNNNGNLKGKSLAMGAGGAAVCGLGI